MFEPKGDENIGDGYTRHQNPIAALSCSWLLYFLGEKHASATSSSRLTSEECWCDTRKPRQSGSTQDCAVQQVFWSMVRKWGECSIEVAGSCAGCLICRNSSAGLVASGQPFCSHLTLIYPSGTAVPFPDDCGDCSLWVNSFWGRLFDERRDSNQSLGAFVFWAVA